MIPQLRCYVSLLDFLSKPVLCTVQVYLSEDELAHGDEASGDEEGGESGDGDVDLPGLLGETGQHHAVLQVVKTHPGLRLVETKSLCGVTMFWFHALCFTLSVLNF